MLLCMEGANFLLPGAKAGIPQPPMDDLMAQHAPQVSSPELIPGSEVQYESNPTGGASPWGPRYCFQLLRSAVEPNPPIPGRPRAEGRCRRGKSRGPTWGPPGPFWIDRTTVCGPSRARADCAACSTCMALVATMTRSQTPA